MRLSITLISCTFVIGCKSSSKPKKTDWRTTGRYAELRGVFPKTVTAFPADPSTLPRCKPVQSGVFTASYEEVRRVYAKSAPAPAVTSPLEISGELLRRIEEAEWERSNDPLWSSPPMDWANAIGVFKTTRLDKPVPSDNCEHVGSKTRCGLTPGVVEGDMVVFGPESAPVCANHVRVEGPNAIASGGGPIEETLFHEARDVVELLYWQTPPPADAGWPFIARLDQSPSPPRFTITIDGTIVRQPK